jgi:acyl carrier protein
MKAEEQSETLVKCFRAVFGDLPDAAIQSATTETLLSWDSIAAVTLLNVIEEEFKIEIDYDQLPQFSSFDAILKYISTARR